MHRSFAALSIAKTLILVGIHHALFSPGGAPPPAFFFGNNLKDVNPRVRSIIVSKSFTGMSRLHHVMKYCCSLFSSDEICRNTCANMTYVDASVNNGFSIRMRKHRTSSSDFFPWWWSIESMQLIIERRMT